MKIKLNKYKDCIINENNTIIAERPHGVKEWDDGEIICNVYNNADNVWLSPVESEREVQEKRLKEIFPDYPNGYEKWQYLNRLIDMFPSALSRVDL